MKRTRGTGECFLHFLSILKCPECFITENRRLKFLHLLYDIGVIWRKTIKHAYSLFYTLIKHEILLVVLCYTNRDKVRGLMGPLGSYADLAFSILSPITQWSQAAFVRKRLYCRSVRRCLFVRSDRLTNMVTHSLSMQSRDTCVTTMSHVTLFLSYMPATCFLIFRIINNLKTSIICE